MTLYVIGSFFPVLAAKDRVNYFNIYIMIVYVINIFTYSYRIHVINFDNAQHYYMYHQRD
jgi:hypothetical protein